MKKIIFLILIINTFIYANNIKKLNVYNNIAFMQEKSDIFIGKDNNIIHYNNIPSSIITDSINVKFKYPINILTQEYLYNTPNLNNLLKYNLNKSVYFYLNVNDRELKEGKLISTNMGYSLIKDKNKLIRPITNTNISFKYFPQNMYLYPFLQWKIIPIKKNLNNTLNIQYLLRNINFNSEYNVNLINDKIMELNGWFNIKNNSGINFKNIKLNVIAGKVNNIDNRLKRMYVSNNQIMMDKVSMKGSIRNSDIKGLKKYSIPFKVDLLNKQNTQIRFIKEKIPYKLINKLDIYSLYGFKNKRVFQYINFKYNLDKELPSGNIRFYKNAFLGSNRIKDLTKGMNISLKLNQNYNLFFNNQIIKNIKKKNIFKHQKICKDYYNIKSILTINNNDNNNQEILINFKLDKYNYVSFNKDKSLIIKKDLNNNKIIKLDLKGKSKKIIQINLEKCYI